ncbi:winged helix-turn-helix domain-containing protein, partial [Salmonella enterica subsp. enterica serovar Typhimurium]|uniref:ArsR/SmtB family transcription factor n=1 Tax=Salmonella enterica TaxID=28901 RepID=UPI002FFC0DD0
MANLIRKEVTFESSIAAIGAAMSDISRVKILSALMDGRACTATELSAVANISASTASRHLAK